jgi:hypothetical protein
MKNQIILIAICLSAIFSAQSYAQGNFSSPLIGIGVVASDLEKSLNFYTNGIGMVKVSEFSVNSDVAKRTGLTGGIPFDVTVLKLADSKEANQWKLMSFGKKSKGKKQKFIQDDTRMRYITINVKSLKPCIESLKAIGVEFLGETPTQLGENRYLLLVQDPDGTFVELIGPME